MSIYFYAFGSLDGSEVKLGITDSPKIRKSQHENVAGNIQPLRTIAVWQAAAPDDERTLKELFKGYRTRAASTEWFDARNEGVRGWLRWLCAQPFTVDDERATDFLPIVDGTSFLPTQDRLLPAPALHMFEKDAWADLCVSAIMEGDYYTPPDIISCARHALGGVIDLDPASCKAANKIVGARLFFGVLQNGLKQSWSGRVWLNPPFADWESWSPKILKEIGNTQAMIVHGPVRCLGSKNIEPVLKASTDCLIWTGRPEYWGPKAGGKKGPVGPGEATGSWLNCFNLYFGTNKTLFRQAFANKGVFAKWE